MNLGDLIGKSVDFWSKYEAQLLQSHPHVEKYGSEIVGIESLAQVVANETGREIQVVKVKSETDIYSQVFIYESKAVIELAPWMNTCWNRFSIAKELVHVWLAGNECLVKSDVDESLMLRLARDSRYVFASTDQALDGETAGIYGAIEFLLPWSIRKEISDQRHDNNKTNFQIAEKYLVPMVIIDQLFDLNYGEVSSKIHLDLHS